MNVRKRLSWLYDDLKEYIRHDSPTARWILGRVLLLVAGVSRRLEKDQLWFRLLSAVYNSNLAPSRDH